jgi:acetyl-CoA decarbonylase/synthase complex subunit gamma
MGGISSFLAMNFTGSSTFTSLSGVQKEMKTALPAQITAASLGFIVWTITRFI